MLPVDTVTTQSCIMKKWAMFHELDKETNARHERNGSKHLKKEGMKVNR